MEVFFSYSHDDEGFRDQLEKHLAMLKRQGLITTWHDRQLLAGSTLDEGIDEKLETADIILLLVSSSFLASEYCFSREMRRAMERHAEHSAVVIPIILRPCDWKQEPLKGLTALPTDARPIAQWPDQDEAFTVVAREIRRIVEAGAAHSARGPAVIAPSRSATTTASLPRSSNLRLKKEFSDLDRDTFLKESFEFLARFFEGSLHELAGRNPGIEGRFERVDARTFLGSIYKAGKRQAQCSIHLGAGALGRGITYSNDPSARGNSFNEQLTVKVDDQSIFLRSMGMASWNNNREEQLSPEGGAELFWGMLIQGLQ